MLFFTVALFWKLLRNHNSSHCKIQLVKGFPFQSSSALLIFLLEILQIKTSLSILFSSNSRIVWCTEELGTFEGVVDSFLRNIIVHTLETARFPKGIDVLPECDVQY